MPQTLGDIIKLGDLPLEQKTMMRDGIVYSNEHDSEMVGQTNKLSLDANRTSLTYLRTYLPEVDKESDRYKNGLVEGVTPEPEKINEAEFTIPVKEIGWYYNYTNKMLNHSFTDFRTRARNYLANISKSYFDEKIADTYLSSANLVTGLDLLKLDDLLKLRTMLVRNGAETIDGFYILKTSTEAASKMLSAYKDLITHTTQKEAVIKGELGEIAGFRLVESKLQAFLPGSGTSPFVAYGKTSKGEFPVSQISYDDNAQIIFKALGTLGNDQLNQRGSIGLYMDGHNVFMQEDAICIRGNATVTGVEKIEKFDRTKASNLTDTNEAPSGLYPDVSFVRLKVDETHTLVIKDKLVDGSDVTSSCTFTSLNTKIATVDSTTTKGKITAVKSGTTKILVEKSGLATVVTVEVVAKDE